MRLHLVRIEPSSKRGVFQVDAPSGSQALLARMNRMGEGEIVFASPDAVTALEPTQILSLWEDDAPKPSEPVGDWRLLGSLNYSSGGWQHLFARVQQQPQKQKRAVDTSTGSV